jgi:hypothetical protein
MNKSTAIKIAHPTISINQNIGREVIFRLLEAVLSLISCIPARDCLISGYVTRSGWFTWFPWFPEFISAFCSTGLLQLNSVLQEPQRT